MIKSKSENLSRKSRGANSEIWRLKLDKNENVYGISKFVVNAVKNMDFDRINFYSNPDKLLDKLSEEYNCPRNCFLLTNGILEALCLIANTYLNKNEEILSYNPILSSALEIQGIKFKEIEYSKKYKFSADDIEKNISDNTKAIYFSTPDIITGELVKAQTLSSLINKYPDIIFIIDCSYINFALNASAKDYLELADKFDNVAVIKSFSYDYALAGVEFSFIYAQNNIMRSIQKTSTCNSISAFAIECGYGALNDKKYIKEVKTNNSAARQLLYDGLLKKGFAPYQSSGNFILCDFSDYCDFYYQKLKNNGVITKNFDKKSQYSTCLRITIPKTGGVKYILELLNKRDVLVINPDNVIFDTKESLDYAISKTFKHFTGFSAEEGAVLHVRNLSGYNCAWDIVKYMLEEKGFFVEPEEIMSVFINFFYNPKLRNSTFLIDEDELLISKDNLEKLSQKYDLVLFSDRLKMHLDYSLEKYEIDKYFHYIMCADNLDIENKKPNNKGLSDILKHCPYKGIKYIGANVDDIICANSLEVEAIGAVNIHADKVVMVNNFRHLGARHIIENVDEILKFLNENEQK